MTFVNDEGVKRLLSLAAKPVVIAERFELGNVIGEGGMGIVYEAWDCLQEQSVALKVLHRDLARTNDTDDARAVRFEREANSLAQISHPAVVDYVAHGVSAEGDHYLAMELLAGETLAARLATTRLSIHDALRVGHSVAIALAAVHDHGLTHRDVKPDNIFLQDGEPGQAKLLDFGLVRAFGAATVTRTGSLVGTPRYMAPEQVRAKSPPDTRADLFALGSVLFECLTGRAAFVSDDTEELLVKVLITRPVPVRELCPGVPAALDALVSQLLAADPVERPASATEVALCLAALLQGEASTQHEGAAALVAPNTLIAGKYRVERELGRGGMGVVLLAHHEALDRQVALKLLNGDKHDAQGRAVARLAREARATSALTSEHVARVMDVDTHDDGTPFIVMEFLRGQDLAQLLTERGRLSVTESVDYVLQATEALVEAHALGIVHRDLKPSNLFLTTRKDGTPLIKVLDFGISKLAQVSDEKAINRLLGEGSITAPDAVFGSPLYMSPEQLQNTTRVDARTDVWSIGVVLYQLLTGRLPFQAESVMALGAKIASEPPADLRKERPEIPVGLCRVVLRCLAKAPADRFATVAELKHALLRFGSFGSPEHTGVRTKRWRTAAIVGAAVAVLAVVVSSMYQPAPVATDVNVNRVDQSEHVTATSASTPGADVAVSPSTQDVDTPTWTHALGSSAAAPTALSPSPTAPPSARAHIRRVTSSAESSVGQPQTVPQASPPAPKRPVSNVADPMNPALLER